MKTELIALHVKHLNILDGTDQRRNALRMSGPAFCLLADGEPVAAGGIARLGLSRGIAWALITERAKNSALLMRRIHKHAKIQFPLVRSALGFKYVDAEADPYNPKACAWLEYFGFRRTPITLYSWIDVNG